MIKTKKKSDLTILISVDIIDLCVCKVKVQDNVKQNLYICVNNEKGESFSQVDDKTNKCKYGQE